MLVVAFSDVVGFSWVGDAPGVVAALSLPMLVPMVVLDEPIGIGVLPVLMPVAGALLVPVAGMLLVPDGGLCIV